MTQPANRRLLTEASGDARYATAAQGAKADAATPVLVLAVGAPVPGGTPAGTVIVRF